MQLAELTRMRRELEELGLERVRLDEHCYVYAYLPASEGTLALTKDLNGVKNDINDINETLDGVSKDIGVLQTDVERISKKVDGYISIQDLQQALGEAVASDIPKNEYTLEDIRISYNKLLQSLRNLIKEN